MAESFVPQDGSLRVEVHKDGWGDFHLNLEQFRVDDRGFGRWTRLDRMDLDVFTTTKWSALLFARIWLAVSRRRLRKWGSLNKPRNWVVE